MPSEFFAKIERDSKKLKFTPAGHIKPTEDDR